MQREPIAIVGIGCRLPGAANPARFWQLLCEGRDAIREVPEERWQMETLYAEHPELRARQISHWGGFLDGVDGFDWRFFHMSPREAMHVDPQHRLLLEVAWEALEDAGVSMQEVAGSQTSVAIGISWNDYLRLQAHHLEQLNGYTVVGNPYSFAANRLSYAFDLRGPSVSLDAGCTSSLAALYSACQSLWTGEADLALAGGVNLILSPDSMIMMSQAGLLSPQGVCRALDASADGCVRGEGAGVVVLKPLSRVEPSDRVYALIHGVALSHNGHNEWIMATSADAQERLLREAYARAALDPARVDYVELHGTGFLRGDAVETGALGAVLGQAANRMLPCHIGSLKTNIGNLEAASGIASLIKVALSLFHRYMPPTLNLFNLNPAIDLPTLQLEAQRKGQPWPEYESAPLAGINTISFTGANGHAILGGWSPQAVELEPVAETCAEPLPLTLSAASEPALADLVQAFHVFLGLVAVERTASWQDICYTSTVRRTRQRFCLTVYARSCQEAAGLLQEYQRGNVSAQIVIGDVPALAPGQLQGRCVSLPTYPWQRQRLWLDLARDTLAPGSATTPRREDASLATQAAQEQGAAFFQRFQQVEAEHRGALVTAYLAEQVMDVLGLAPGQVDLTAQSLFELGIDSLSATKLLNRVHKDLPLALSLSILFSHPTLESLADFITTELVSSSALVAHSAEATSIARSEPDITRLSDAELEALLLTKFREIEKPAR